MFKNNSNSHLVQFLIIRSIKPSMQFFSIMLKFYYKLYIYICLWLSNISLGCAKINYLLNTFDRKPYKIFENNPLINNSLLYKVFYLNSNQI